jgi:hypothetical protein
VSTSVGYVIRLHEAKVFYEAVPVAHGTARRYMRAPTIPMLVKASDASC